MTMSTVPGGEFLQRASVRRRAEAGEQFDAHRVVAMRSRKVL
jgi:hypothetical protein